MPKGFAPRVCDTYLVGTYLGIVVGRETMINMTSVEHCIQEIGYASVLTKCFSAPGHIYGQSGIHRPGNLHGRRHPAAIC